MEIARVRIFFVWVLFVGDLQNELPTHELCEKPTGTQMSRVSVDYVSLVFAVVIIFLLANHSPALKTGAQETPRQSRVGPTLGDNNHRRHK